VENKTPDKVPENELTRRMARFTNQLDKVYENWELCAIIGGVNMFYLTGTMCDGLLLLRRGEKPILWVRRSYERAVAESELSDIRRMKSFREVFSSIGTLPSTLYIDLAAATLQWYALLSKYVHFQNTLPIDTVMLNTRAVKSEYELGFMRQAGTLTDRFCREALPALLRDGISEVELGAELFALFLKNGFHGVSRFSMRNVDSLFGHVSFGESPLYPSSFNGASGINGLCPAAPVLGNRDRFLHSGDLIYIDIGTGIGGYHIDKTLILSYKMPQSEHVIAAHRHCLELERHAASMLRPGIKPSDIYSEIMDMVKPEYRHCFMGSPARTVPFIGHGVGLYVDEMPVIAKGFDAPLECGMTLAIEPKIGINGAGMVGSENTYLVTSGGGISLTGDPRQLDVV
jgi:Xaa-Pro aminopeptidase